MDKRTLPLLFAALTFGLETDDHGCTKLLPFGEFRAVDGRPVEAPHWYTDNQIGSELASALNALKTDILIDYEHQTLNTEKNGQPAPASGWIKPTNVVWRDNEGLFAQIDWTAKASAHIEADEYKYLSPVFLYDRTGKVTKFLHLALTNNPALDSLGEVTAALSKHFNQPTEHKPMDEALKALLCAILGLSENSSEAQITAALNQIVDKVTDGKGLAACSTTLPKFIEENQQQIAVLTSQGNQPDPTKFVPIATVTEMQQKLAALTQESLTRKEQEATTLVQAALSDGRLLPAQKEWAESLAKNNMAFLTGYLATAVPVAALTQTQTGGNPPEGKSNGQLTENQLAVCKNLGIAPEDYLKEKESEPKQ